MSIDIKHVYVGLSLNLLIQSSHFSSLKLFYQFQTQLQVKDVCQVEDDNVICLLKGQNKNCGDFHYALQIVFWDPIACQTQRNLDFKGLDFIIFYLYTFEKCSQAITSKILPHLNVIETLFGITKPCGIRIRKHNVILTY